MKTTGYFFGIDKYKDSGISDLAGAKRDATVLYSLFSDSLKEINSSLILDKNANYQTLSSKLIKTLNEATNNDNLIITFSGHGSNNHRLIASDTSIKDLDNSSIDMSDIAESFRKSNANSILMILDCCFSGATPARVLDNTPKSRLIFSNNDFIVGKGKVLITASGLNEPAYESPTTGHGLLTNNIITVFTNSKSETINLASAMEQVLSLVQAEASSIGCKQTPVSFNLIDGSFSIPTLKKGNSYNHFFPDNQNIIIKNNLDELTQFAIPSDIINTWKNKIGNTFLDIQLKAINDKRILNGNSLVLSAPTSSGKTFIGELAAIKSIIENKKAVFLFPYKALVNEKFEYFSEIYSNDLNLKLIRCTGDYLDNTNDFIKAKFDIAILTYEMFFGLVTAFPSILFRIGLVVIDESQFISDSNRGIVVEMILTKLKIVKEQINIKPQLLLLSATIGDINDFDIWLGIDKLITKERPVPLEFGVLDRNGNYIFMDSAGNKDEKQLLQPGSVIQRGKKPSSQDVIVPLCKKLLKDKNEKIIVFRNTRGAVEGCANYLANELDLSNRKLSTLELINSDSSSTSKKLLHCLSNGVSFHNSNLSREERILVEQSYRDTNGEIKVIVATSTLAAGINTPASTVLIVEHSYPWENKSFSISEIQNMAGRAGRLGYQETGKAIILANSHMEKESLFNNYIDNKPEPIESTLRGKDIGSWIIKLLSQVLIVPIDQLPVLLSNTFGGFLNNLKNPNWIENISNEIENVIRLMNSYGLLEIVNNNYQLSLPGKICGRSSLSFDSCLRFIDLSKKVNEKLSCIDLTALINNLQELDSIYVPFFTRGYSESLWPQRLSTSISHQILSILQFDTADLNIFKKRCKKICIVVDWLNGFSIVQIENAYSANVYNSVGAGDIRTIAESTRYHLRSCFEIINTANPQMAPSPIDMEIFMKQLEVGIPLKGIELVELNLELTRGEYLGLIHSNIFSSKDFTNSNKSQIINILGKERTDEIYNQHLNVD